MKRLNILIAALAMTGAAFAQTTAKDSIAAAKAAAKEKIAAEKLAAKERALAEKAAKAQKAADLKAFIEKQKQDLAAFKEGQKASGAAQFAMPALQLTTHDDSIAHIFGIAQSNGLKQYLVAQLNVDTTYINDFCRGVLDRTSVDPNNKQLAAYNAGGQIGSQIMSMAQNFSKDYYEADPDKAVDPKIVAHGILQGLMEQGEMKADSAGQVFQKALTERQAENKERLYGENRRAGEKFLEENKRKEGVVTLPSGLQYKVITEGTGEKPKATDKVKVNYEGKLIDGTVFDSSIKRGQPATFQVSQVIKGWTEALKLMPVGSKWEIYIPYQLAYGDRATGKDIKPYSALTFSVELLDIETPAKKKAAEPAVVPTPKK